MGNDSGNYAHADGAMRYADGIRAGLERAIEIVKEDDGNWDGPCEGYIGDLSRRLRAELDKLKGGG